MKFGNEVEILQMKGCLEILNDVKVNLEFEEDDIIQYVYDLVMMKIVLELFGNIWVSSIFVLILFVSGDGIYIVCVKMEIMFKLIIKD